MKCTRKYKLNVVNIGVKMFSKNRDDKSNAKVNIILTNFIMSLVSFIARRVRNFAALYE